MLSYRLHPKTNRFIVLGRKLTEFNVFGKTPSLVLLRLLLQNYQCSLVCLALRFFSRKAFAKLRRNFELTKFSFDF
jgi:hypothetical protein